MLHKDFDYKGSDVKTHTILADDQELLKIQKYAKELVANTVSLKPFDKAVERLRHAEFVVVRGKDYDLEVLRRILPKFESLLYLGIPVELIDLLDMELPRTLQTLNIGGEGVSKLPKLFHSASLERILSVEAITSFDISQVPSVSRFFMRTGIKARILDEIAKAAQIQVLTISDHKTLHDIPNRDWRDVRYLRVMNNSFESLDGISNFSGLTDLYSHSNSKLSDIRQIAELKNLKELTIAYCSKLKEVGILASTHLKVLTIFGCRGLRKAEVQQIVKGLNLEELTLNI